MDLRASFLSSIDKLLARVAKEEQSGRRLLGLGLATDDTISSMGAFLLFEGDKAADDPSTYFAPMSWGFSTEAPFVEFNHALDAARPQAIKTGPEFPAKIFDLCSDLLEQRDIRSVISPQVFLSFCGIDPAPYMTPLEGEFVRRFNSPELYEGWKRLNQPEGG